MRRKTRVILPRDGHGFNLEARFENGIFWELYNDLESQFRNFLEYVPFRNNEYTYSFKLLNLILSLGGHIDSAFKEMARFRGFAENPSCSKILKMLEVSKENVSKGKAPVTIPINLSLEAFEKEYELSSKEVIFKSLGEDIIVRPFKSKNSINVPQ